MGAGAETGEQVSTLTLAQFTSSALAHAPSAATGNTDWAREMAEEVKRVIRRQAELEPRSQQVHLGPSELGTPCDRQIVGKLLRHPHTNHVMDPWPSVVGRAVHAWLATAFAQDDPQRWITERRVVPHPEHAGTGDLYDRQQSAVLDFKVQGESTARKVRSVEGPPRRYQAQLFLYGLGFMRAGLPVHRVGLVSLPRTKSTLDDTYVWEAPMDESAAELIRQVFTDTQRRKDMAELVRRGLVPIERIPRVPDHDECAFCPFYRPESGHDNGPGCPGTIK